MLYIYILFNYKIQNKYNIYIHVHTKYKFFLDLNQLGFTFLEESYGWHQCFDPIG